jgi:putative DNA methylase
LLGHENKFGGKQLAATVTRRKLIEVALPLDEINAASAREKSIRHGHPSTLHLWWARRPLAAARAVIFAQMVDDPSEYVDTLLSLPEMRRRAEAERKKRLEVWRLKPDDAVRGPEPTLAESAAGVERDRLFGIIKDLVKWENTTNEAVLQKARDEIWQSWRRACADNADHPRASELFDRRKLPAFHDPFAGGGSLPLEAQRLGLEVYASDLNPVAVLINKAMIEIPPKFAGRPPVNPDWTSKSAGERGLRVWKGSQGLAEDVRHYGQSMRDEAEKRIGHLYPKVEITAEMARERPDLKPLVGQKLTAIAWLWARTVKSPNPAFANVDVPLVSTFMLSTKPGRETYVEPVIEGGGYRFTVKVGKPKNAEAARLGTTAGKRNAFRCLMSGVPVTYDHIREEGKAGRMGGRLMAIVAESEHGRVYISPTEDQNAAAHSAKPEWKPDMPLPNNPRDFKTPNYGLNTFGDLFTDRQLVALTTFSDLVAEARDQARRDALATGLLDDGTPLYDEGAGVTAYAESVATYLTFAVDKAAEGSTTLCVWSSLPSKLHIVGTFGRQALPMSWDYAEANVFADSSGNILRMCELVANVIERQFSSPVAPGVSQQSDAARLLLSAPCVISTDPPYYDNIGYADLSDFFFIWLRRALRTTFPALFATLAVPKSEELVATPYRHGGKEKAESFFLKGMTQAMHRLAEQAHPAFPVSIYYAFRQSETRAQRAQ